jgi:hypothetical protein
MPVAADVVLDEVDAGLSSVEQPTKKEAASARDAPKAMKRLFMFSFSFPPVTKQKACGVSHV